MKVKRGQGIVEYILIVALLAMIAFVIIQTLGTNVQANFKKASDNVAKAGQGL